MNRSRDVKFSNSIFSSSNIPKVIAVAGLLALLSFYFQNLGALVAMSVLVAGVFIGNVYERRH